MTDTWTLPEGNERSGELFAELNAVIEKMRAHRPDDLIGAFYNLAATIRDTDYPELIITEDKHLVCPYCLQQVAEDSDGGDVVTDLRAHDWDTNSYPLWRELEDVEDIILSGTNSNTTEWESLYIQHGCGAAVSVPTTIDLRLE